MSLKYSCITCCPGSGSTVFAQLLNVHPDILSTHELGMCSRNPFRLVRRVRSGVWFTKSNLGKMNTPGFLERKWKIDDIIHHRKRIILAACRGGMALSRELVNYSEKEEAHFFIDKLPDPPAIKKFLKKHPGFHVVYLHRNPFAVVNSILRKTRGKHTPGTNWGPKLKGVDRDDDFEVLAARQYCSCLEALQQMREISGGTILEVYYEDFVRMPVAVYQEVFDFLGVSVHGDTQVEIERMFTGFPLRSGRLDGWQTELSFEQIKLASSILGEHRDWIPGRYEISGPS